MNLTINKVLFLIAVLFVGAAFSNRLVAQNCVGETKTYNFSFGCSGNLTSVTWQGASGGIISPPYAPYSGAKKTMVDVTFTNPGSGYTLVGHWDVCPENPTMSVGTISNTSATPSSSYISANLTCNNGQVDYTLQWTGTNSQYVYWQTAATGESTANPASMQVSGNGTYYVRRKLSGECWSSAVSYTVNNYPDVSDAGYLEGSSTQHGVGYGNLWLKQYNGTIDGYWYTDDNWVTKTKINSSQSSLTYYFENNTQNIITRKYKASILKNGCELLSEEAVITVNPVSFNTTCQNLQVSLGCPQPSAVGGYQFVDTWWEIIKDGAVSTVNHSGCVSADQVLDVPGISVIRQVWKGYDNTTARNVYIHLNSTHYDVVARPSTPAAPSISAGCGVASLEFSGSPGTGVNWYWQGQNSNGYGITFDESSYWVSEPGTYYLRARNDNGCWSEQSRSVVVSANDLWVNDLHIVFSTQSCAGGLKTVALQEQTCKQAALSFETRTYDASSSSWSAWGSLNGYSEIDDQGRRIWYVPQVDDAAEFRVSYYDPYDASLDITSNILLQSTSYTPNWTPKSSLDQNYVKVYQPKDERQNCIRFIDDPDLVTESISYLDGLGRSIQEIVREGAITSGGNKDLVSFVDYDATGRVEKHYLPYPASTANGSISTDPVTAQKDFYTGKFGAADGAVAFTQSVYDDSPLNRVVEQAAPGDSWKVGSNHTVESEFTVNDGTEQIRELYVDNGSNIITVGSNYLKGKLTKEIVNDENPDASGGETISYTNQLGQVVAKQVKLNSTRYTTTYYIYDDYGNLRYVVQPEGIRLIEEDASYQWSNINDQSFKDNWVFCYQYDARKRMTAKRVPGSDWVYMVYDERDRLVFTSDANQRAVEVVGNGDHITIDQYNGKSYKVDGSGSVTIGPGYEFKASGTKEVCVTTEGSLDYSWTYTLYDQFNRPVATGILHMPYGHPDQLPSFTAEDFTVNYTGSGSLMGYSNSTFAVSITTTSLLSVTYYDNYDFKSDQGWSADFNYTHIDLETSLKGQTTGAMTRILASDQWLKSISYYDSRYRVIAAITENHKGGVDKVETTYRNKVHARVEQTVTTHNVSGGSDLVVTETFDYDHMDRLKEATHQIGNGTTVRLSASEYNELGEAIQKKVGSHNGGSTFAQTIDYAYNIRGWLTAINGGTSLSGNDKFGMALKYDDASSGFEQYNGNIGEIQWKTLGGGSLNQGVQTYTYSYDRLNRLKKANYNSTGAVNHFTVGGDDNGQIRYDHNGNILNLNRNFNGSMVDNLSYTYINGNQLAEVSDLGTTTLFEDKNPANGAGDYTYDANGNMISDYNKDITQIHYNHLNLPEMVVMDDGDYVKYIYNAAGIKLQKEARQGANVTVSDYISGKHYVDGTLSFLQHAEGRARYDASSFHYEYNLTDHLGNVRVSVDEGGNVVQRDDYYPFGLTFNSFTSGAEYLYKLTGNEEQNEWDVFDFNARMYDAALGRFNSIDPLADFNQESWNPYHFNYNNPLRFIDPTGLYSTEEWMEDNGITEDDLINIYSESDDCPTGDCDQGEEDAEGDEYSGGNLGDDNQFALHGDLEGSRKTTTWSKTNDKRIKELKYFVSIKATQFVNAVEARLGIKIFIVEGYRSSEKQNEYYAQGRPRVLGYVYVSPEYSLELMNPDPIITNAKGGSSYHNYGLAIDIAGYKNGKLNYKIPWKQISDIAKEFGFEWGGDWKSFQDKPHFQITGGQSISDLKKKSN